MEQSHKEDGQKEKKFKPGSRYFSPFRNPGEPPVGYKWGVVERHKEKNYPLYWSLQSLEPDVPDMDELPPIDRDGKESVIVPELPGFSIREIRRKNPPEN